ncbi:hypothetical protein Bca4012_037770 [Brassica carinata]
MFFFSDAVVVLPRSAVDPTETTIDFDWRDDETMVRARRGESAFRTEGLDASFEPVGSLKETRLRLSTQGPTFIPESQSGFAYETSSSFGTSTRFFCRLQVGFMGSLSCLCLGLYGFLGFRFSRTSVRIWLRTGAVNANGYKPFPVMRLWCRGYWDMSRTLTLWDHS